MIAESDYTSKNFWFSAMNHRKKFRLNSRASWRKSPFKGRSSEPKYQPQQLIPAKLLALLNNSLVQFLLGLFLIALFTQAADYLESLSVKLIIKSIGYGTFFYLATPFVLYWLAYVSSAKLTKIKLSITILLVAIYSYVFWDSYFSYKHILGELLFSALSI